MAKNEIDMTHGPMWGKVLQYALPVAATSMLEQLFNATGVLIVGNFSHGDTNAEVAAVGSNMPVVGLILNLFIGVALGANVVIANAIGRGSRSGVRRAVVSALAMAVIGGIACLLIGEAIAAPLMGWMNVTSDVAPHALVYLRIWLLCMPTILLYNFEAAIFRSVGDTQTPLIALCASGLVNVAVSLLLVVAFQAGVAGVAVGIVVSTYVSSGVLLVRLKRTDTPIRMDVRRMFAVWIGGKRNSEAHSGAQGSSLQKGGLQGSGARNRDGASDDGADESVTMPDWLTVRSILAIGLPAGLQSAVFSLANIIIQVAINSLGTVVMAASSAAFNIEILAYFTLNAFSQACATFTGQNRGAREWRRCREALGICLFEGFIATFAMMGILLAAGRWLLALFDSDPQVIAVGYQRLEIIFSGYVFSLIYEVSSGYLRGFGISLVPAILTIAGVCGSRISWIAAVFPRWHTFGSLMLIYPLSLALTAVLIGGAALAYHPVARRLKAGGAAADMAVARN